MYILLGFAYLSAYRWSIKSCVSFADDDSDDEPVARSASKKRVKYLIDNLKALWNSISNVPLF